MSMGCRWLWHCWLIAGYSAAALGGIDQWQITPTALVRQGEPPRQRVDLTIDATDEISNLTVKVRAGVRLLEESSLGALKRGRNELSILLPEPAAPVESHWELCLGDSVVAERSLVWAPPRHWTIYEVFSSHVDLGLHDSQYKQRQMGSRFLDRAQELVEQTASRPSPCRFRYVVEGLWWWRNYERDRSERAARDLIERYAKPGIIGIGASHSGNRTEVYGKEELCRSAYYARELRYRWGLAADSMLMVDNNGITWPLVTAYADAGIRYLGFYPNPWNPDAVNCWKPGGTPGSRIDVGWESKLPHLFYWQGPDAKRRILVWTSLSYGNLSSFSFGHNQPEPAKMADVMAKQLAVAESRYPYDVWMVPYYGDNQEPNLGAADRARAWNEVWRWPELRTTGDLSVPFKEVEARFGERIPTLSGLMTAGWAQHPVSTPTLLAAKMAADRLLPVAEKLATVASLVDPEYLYPANRLRDAWDALICNDEHGYGTSYYKGRPVYDTWMQKRDWIEAAAATAGEESKRALEAIASRVAAASPSVLVFNPTLQSRCDLVEVDWPEAEAGGASVRGPDGRVLPAVKRGGKLRFLAPEVPSFGYAVFAVQEGASGETVRQAVLQPPVIENAHYRVAFDADGAVASIVDHDLHRELLDSRAPYRCNQLVYSRDGNQTFGCPAAARFEVETSPLEQAVIATLEDSNSGAQIVQRVALPNDGKRIDIENRLSHVRDLAGAKRWDRFGYYAFPFEVPGAELRIGLNGCSAKGYAQQTGLTTDSYFAAREWADVSNAQFGITLVQLDSQLIECGKIHTPKRTFGEQPENAHLYSYAFNDWLYAHAYATGPSHLNFCFRYAIQSHAGPFQDAQVPAGAERVATPLLAMAIPDQQTGSLPAGRHGFLAVDGTNLELLTLKHSEDPGRGVIARFHETEGRGANDIGVRSGFAGDWQWTRCTLLERDEAVLERPRLDLDPFGYFTARLLRGGPVPDAPAPEVRRVSDSVVELGWQPVTGAAQYLVFAGDEDAFPADEYHLLGATREPGYRDAGHSPGEETRYYRVAAVSAGARRGNASGPVRASTLQEGNSPPAKVGSAANGLIASPRAWRGDRADTLYLQWGQNRERDLSHYEIYRGRQPGLAVGTATFLARVDPGSYATVPYEDRGLDAHATYYYRVVAVDRDGNRGEPSEECRGTTREMLEAK